MPSGGLLGRRVPGCAGHAGNRGGGVNGLFGSTPLQLLCGAQIGPEHKVLHLFLVWVLSSPAVYSTSCGFIRAFPSELVGPCCPQLLAHGPRCHSQAYGPTGLCCLSLEPRLPGTVAKSQEMGHSSIQRGLTELLRRAEGALWGGTGQSWWCHPHHTHGLVGDGECVVPQCDRGYGGNGRMR